MIIIGPSSPYLRPLTVWGCVRDVLLPVFPSQGVQVPNDCGFWPEATGLGYLDPLGLCRQTGWIGSAMPQASSILLSLALAGVHPPKGSMELQIHRPQSDDMVTTLRPMHVQAAPLGLALDSQACLGIQSPHKHEDFESMVSGIPPCLGP